MLHRTPKQTNTLSCWFAPYLLLQVNSSCIYSCNLLLLLLLFHCIFYIIFLFLFDVIYTVSLYWNPGTTISFGINKVLILSYLINVVSNKMLNKSKVCWCVRWISSVYSVCCSSAGVQQVSAPSHGRWWWATAPCPCCFLSSLLRWTAAGFHVSSRSGWRCRTRSATTACPEHKTHRGQRSWLSEHSQGPEIRQDPETGFKMDHWLNDICLIFFTVCCKQREKHSKKWRRVT